MRRKTHKYNKACHGCGEQVDIELEEESDYCSVCIKAGKDEEETKNERKNKI